MTRPRILALTLALVLLATGLRVYHLSAQSFWNDEGNSARIAERTPNLILAGAAGDIHPPGYYLLLAGWRAALGQSEFALRLFSTLVGVLTVAVVIRLGHQYFDPPAALLAGLLAAGHSALVYYSQEARMYSQLGLLAALTLLLMTKWLKATRTRPLTHPAVLALSAAYTLTTAAGLWTHYAFPLALFAINLTAVSGLVFHRRPGQSQRLFGWLGLNALASLLFAPWLPTAVRQITTWPASGDGLPIPQATLAITHWLTLGPTATLPPAWTLFLAVLLLALALTHRGQTITPLFAALIPAGIVLFTGIYSDTFAKFLIIAVPAWLVLLSNGLAALVPTPAASRRLPAVLIRLTAALTLLAALMLNTAALRALYFDPAFTRADYRAIAAYIQSVAHPGDAVLLNAPNQWEVFTYYYPDGPNVFPVARTRPLDIPAQQAELAAITANHDRLFVLYWGDAQSDPQRVVESWLNTHTFKATDTWYSDVRLSVYAVPTVAAEMQTELNARFSGSITLLGITLPQTTLTPGDILQLTLFWQTNRPLNDRYKVFVHVAPAPGQPPLAQRDSEPGGGLQPTTIWPPNQPIADNHGVLLPPTLPPGDYALIIGLYDLITGDRLPLADGNDSITLTTLTIR